MYFSDIIGQESVARELRASFMAGVVPHARLFVDTPGLGGLAMAYAYARYINCASPSNLDACGHCHSCKSFDGFAGRDLHFLFPIVNRDSKNYCDDELSKWREFLSLGPYASLEEWYNLQQSGGKQLSIFARESDVLLEKLSYQVLDSKYRVLMIWLPERMHEALANKLLKLTEEPPDRTVILMVCHKEAQVLGTLRSRMQTIHLKPISEAIIAEALPYLAGQSAGISAERAAHLCAGNILKALNLWRTPVTDLSVEARWLGKILRATIKPQPHEMKALAEEIAQQTREEQLSLLEYMAGMFREIYLQLSEVPAISYYAPSEEAMVHYLKGCVNSSNVHALRAEIDLAIRHVGQNVNSRMVFFDLILRLTATLAPSYKRLGKR